MKAPSTKVRFAEAEKLLDYGFNTFLFKSFGEKGEVVKNISVNKGIKENVDAIYEDNAGTIVEKSNSKRIEQNLKLEDNISSPITKKKKIGEVSFSLDGKILSTTNIIAKDNVDKINLFTMSKHVIYKWVDLLRS